MIYLMIALSIVIVVLLVRNSIDAKEIKNWVMDATDDHDMDYAEIELISEDLLERVKALEAKEKKKVKKTTKKTPAIKK